MTVSTMLTARAEYRRCADALADAAAAHLVAPSPANAYRMQEALRAYTEARKVLDA